ncbi:MAG TPA: DNA-binding protein [Anaerolineae bacterium]|nr:DNA-binding protein [Anaerolineae bacterium]
MAVETARSQAMDLAESLAIQPNVYYTVEETARLLRVSSQAVMDLLRSRQALGIRIGGEWRILGGELFNLPARTEDSEAALVADWLTASLPSLRQVWDNEDDAIYDQL